MEKNLAGLASLLAEKTASDREQIEAQTSEQLRLHAETLRQLSSAAVSTTKAATVQQHQALTDSLSALHKQSEQHRLMLARATKAQQQALEAEMTKQTKRLLWLMRWPILGALAICLLICGLTWGYWKLASPTMNTGSYEVMKGDGWTTCNIGTPQQPLNRPCRRLSWTH